MSNEQERRLLEKIAAAIGEALVANEIADTAIGTFSDLQNEVAALIQPGKPRCDHSWYVAGGRDERVCGELATVTCSACKESACDDHAEYSTIVPLAGSGLAASRVAVLAAEGITHLCEDCQEDELTDAERESL